MRPLFDQSAMVHHEQEIGFEELVSMMVEADLKLLSTSDHHAEDAFGPDPLFCRARLGAGCPGAEDFRDLEQRAGFRALLSPSPPLSVDQSGIGL